MKRFLSFLLFLTGFGHAMHSQNLVQNYSFESQSTLYNQSISDFWFNPPGWNPQDWGMVGFDPGSPCIICKPNRVDSLYSGFRGCYIGLAKTPYAYEGQSYIGLQLYDTLGYKRTFYPGPCCITAYDSLTEVDTLDFFLRSFASTKLKSTLQKDSEYVVEYAVHVDTYDRFGKYTKDFGIRLSNDTIMYGDYLTQSLSNTFSPAKVIREKDGWVNVKHSIKANGDELFLTIGNFLQDHQSTWLLAPTDSSYCVSYGETPFQYYFDAIYLYKATDTVFHVKLPPDTTLCVGEELELYAMHDDGFKLEDTVKTFLWSTGSTDSSIIVNTPGLYWVKVEYNHRFWDSDTIYIEPQVSPYTSGLPTYKEGCQGDAVELKAYPDINRILLWNTGLVANQITVRDSGYYWLSAISVCDTVIDSVLVNLIDCDTLAPPLPVYIPNAFTPNGDRLNDFWEIANLPEKNEVIVWNRWGQVMFHTKDYQNNWDGTDTKGEKLPLGIYVYKVIYREYPGIQRIQQGWVSVVE